MCDTEDMITTEERPAEVEEKTNVLLVTDRCDACGAQAYVGLRFGESELLLCGHHFKKSEEKIRSVATSVLDERWKLSDQRQGV